MRPTSPFTCRLLPLALIPFTLLCHAADAPTLNAQAFQADLDAVLKTVHEIHPNPAFSADVSAVSAMAETIRRQAAPSQSRDEVWRQLARLNPLFADAHWLVAYPDWQADSRAHVAAQGGFFPFEVRFDERGHLLIQAGLGGASSKLAGARIVAIDGKPAETAIAALQARTHGDTPAFRSHLLAQRWWYFYWRMYGAPARYKLTLARGKQRWSVTVPASSAMPAVLKENDASGPFTLETRPGCPALMKVAQFDGAQKERFLAFTQDAFARIRKEGVDKLVIDISANGGGDDVMWLEGLMPYLATQRYRTGSTYVKRVLETNPARNEIAGQVVPGQIETWREPQPDHPLAFKGKVEVRIGPSTYSSAVLFANVMRDFGFATLVGEGGLVRRAQSGGVRKWTLPHSGLVVWAPRFVLDPPLPESGDALLRAQPGGEAPRGPSCPASP